MCDHSKQTGGSASSLCAQMWIPSTSSAGPAGGSTSRIRGNGGSLHCSMILHCLFSVVTVYPLWMILVCLSLHFSGFSALSCTVLVCYCHWDSACLSWHPTSHHTSESSMHCPRTSWTVSTPVSWPSPSHLSSPSYCLSVSTALFDPCFWHFYPVTFC